MGWAVKLRTNTPFKGREAAAKQREAGVAKRMVTFTADPDVILSGRETIYRNGERVGFLSSAGFGHTLNQSIGMGYVRGAAAATTASVLDGDYELEVATVRVPAKAQLKPLYDPTMARVKC